MNKGIEFTVVNTINLCMHSSDLSIIQKFLTNQIIANEIIIVMTPYCPTSQHLFHIQEGVILLSLKTMVNQNVLSTLIFFKNSLSRITVM